MQTLVHKSSLQTRPWLAYLNAYISTLTNRFQFDDLHLGSSYTEEAGGRTDASLH